MGENRHELEKKGLRVRRARFKLISPTNMPLYFLSVLISGDPRTASMEVVHHGPLILPQCYHGPEITCIVKSIFQPLDLLINNFNGSNDINIKRLNNNSNNNNT